MKKSTLLLLIFFSLTASLFAQSLPVGTQALEDYYRRSQLLGITDTNVSFTVRPIYPKVIEKKSSIFYPDSDERKLTNKDTWLSKNGKLKVTILPVSIQTEVNSNHPYGWNDGAMIPAKGFQTLGTLGFFAEYGPLSIQFKPEVVLASNNSFSTFNSSQYDVIFARYYDIYNNIDLPVRFGTSAYNKIFWGQSSIRVNYKSLSFGLSTENLWWGPGIQNSLLMSNTSPGFPHLTLNTTKPLNTIIGSFEGQVIGGRLQNSGYAPLEPDHFYYGTDLYIPKPNDWRYLAGFILTWQPKWVSGLFLGFDQSTQTYSKDLQGIKDYLPLFSQIKQTSAPDNTINAQDQLSSFFMRWLWPQEHAEIYFEWGLYNNNRDLTQSFLAPNNMRAYTFGVRKMLANVNGGNGSVIIGIEASQLQGNSITNLDAGNEWYVSQNVRQGYTNDGQELGAGIGPGGNLQSVDVDWVRGLKKIGLQLQRYAHNNDFYYYAFHDSQDYSRHWTDISLAAIWEWNYRNFIFNAKIQGIDSLDYQWALKQNGDDPSFINQTSTFNLLVQAGLTYRF